MKLDGEGLVVQRGGQRCLDDVTVAFASGKLAAIVGPNGAGKSTLLRCLAGVLEPDTGTVKVGGKPLDSWSLRDLAKCRAYLPQAHHLPFPITVSEVVALGRVPHRDGWVEKQDDSSIVEAALARVGLVGFEGRLFRTLSGGERQRVHFARALAQLDREGMAGGILLLDEPIAALDLRHQHGILAVARRLTLERNLTVVVVLHDLNHALAYADMVCLMDRGSIAGFGDPASMLQPDRVREMYGMESEILGAGREAFLRIHPVGTEIPVPVDDV